MRHLPIVAAIIASLIVAALATAILTNYKVWQWLAVTVKQSGYNWQGLLSLNLILLIILVIHSAPLLQALLLSAMFAIAAAVVKWILKCLTHILN